MHRISPLNAAALARTGTLVTMAWQLYRSHFSTYVRLAAIATGWFTVPVLLGLIGIGIGIAAGVANPLGYAIIPLAILLAIASGIFCSAQGLFLCAIITRLAYHILIQQPESVAQARLVLRPRWMGFLGVQILVSLLLYLAQVLMSVPISILSIMLTAVIVQITNQPAIASLISLGLNVLVLVGYLWVLARMYVPDAIYAIEPTATVSNSLNRSWQLSQRSALPILLVISVAFLLVTPLYTLASTPLFLVIGRLIALFGQIDVTVAPGLVIQQILWIVGFGVVLFAAVNVLVLPFWQTIKSVLYYDLRLHQEGANLTFRDRTESPTKPIDSPPSSA